ncbi:MAG: anthranilate synthase component I [Candidatus Schekmanbacteria bacterium]|nr:anthranilate synthase component I [Candidatus Schekmanbacteria bacterium]
MYTPNLNEFLKLAKPGTVIPVYREILADMDTPVSALAKIDSGRYAYLLESVQGGEKWARYSFLGGEPALVIKWQGRQIELIKNGQREIKNVANPLDFLRQLLARYQPVQIPGLPRFWGGLVGYMAYDIVRHWEKLPIKTSDDLQIPDAVFLLTDNLLIFDNVNLKVKVVSNVFLDEGIDPKQAYIQAQERIDGIIARLKQPVIHPPLEDLIPQESQFSANMPREDYEQIVRQAKEYIAAGDIFQVVLAQRFQCKAPKKVYNIYRALRSINPSPYMFYLKLDDFALVGASPEVLVRMEEGKITLRPIAGTRKRGQDEAEDQALEKDLLQDTKERAEHLMLVDLGRNDVGRVAQTGSVKVDEFMLVERYSHVMHLVSNVTGKLTGGRDAFDVLAAAFPAGTVSGAPKIRAMEIIEELEPTRRGPYAGAVGYFSFSGNMDTCITIRTILVKDGQAYVTAGAGIVADSDPASEYQESVNKAKAMMRALQLAQANS